LKKLSQYAMTQNNLGNAYGTLAEVEDKSQNCKKAIATYKEALRVLTEKEYPGPYHVVETNVRNLLKIYGNSIEKSDYS
jgi:t-SNARE complex subunit (syntaxin)